ncbi:MAG: GNAT family N-acetyltransferase [Acidobacteria bacterium]|nr:GNAT family N-acetyltransferase [Acidobacteriota bacterium]
MLTLRDASPSDAGQIVQFIRDLALYERAPEKAVVTEADILRFGFSENPLIHTVMAEWDGHPAGFALWFHNFSTWEGRPGIYLEDLFVKPEFRGHGIGKALLKRLAKTALDLGCTRYQWQVLDWNTPSLDFYEAMGAKTLREWLTCRVEGEALRALADGAP